MKHLKHAVLALLVMAIGMPMTGFAAHRVDLPLEALTDGAPGHPYITSLALQLSPQDLANADELYFECSRCGRYAAPEFERTFYPIAANSASVRIVGGVTDRAQHAAIPWIPIIDANVTLPDAERIAGGVNGGFYTIHASIKLDDAMRARLSSSALNTIEFQFNGTDGASNGFRILDIALRNEAHQVLGDNEYVDRDPLVEHQAGAVPSADADAGGVLWRTASLVKSTLTGAKINGKCASCHASHGQDLQYFNYSDNAIVQRSEFHGLTAAQGEQIAAYIHYANRDLPYAEKARPYNPVYQPRPGLDEEDVSQWAAGGGLDAVLTTGQQAAEALFGASPGTGSQATIDQVMSPGNTLNMRELQIPIQLPDWNAWLPPIAPEDVWPATGGAVEGSFANGATFANGFKHPLGKFEDVTTTLDGYVAAQNGGHDWSLLTPPQRLALRTKLGNLGQEAYGFLGGTRGNHINSNGGGRYGAEAGAAQLEKRAAAEHQGTGATGAFSHAAFIERAVASMMQWETLRQWELVQTYDLQGDQTILIGDVVDNQWQGRGEQRGWDFNTPGPFYVAPHMMYQQEVMPDGKLRQDHFAWEENNIVASHYRTNAWYQLQQVINPGAKDKFLNVPVDWPYAFDFDEQLVDAYIAGGDTDMASAQAVRAVETHIKAGQYVNNAIAINDPAIGDSSRNPGFGSKAMAAKHLVPTYYVDWYDPSLPINRYHVLDTASPGLYLKVLSGAVAVYNALYAGIDINSWRRCAAPGVTTWLGTDEAMSGMSYCLDAAPRALPTDRMGREYLPFYSRTLYQSHVWGYQAALALGVEPVRMKTWLQWIGKAWPDYSLPPAQDVTR